MHSLIKDYVYQMPLPCKFQKIGKQKNYNWDDHSVIKYGFNKIDWKQVKKYACTIINFVAILIKKNESFRTALTKANKQNFTRHLQSPET